MPLRDHFHPPTSKLRHWHAFHNAWAASLAAALNERLPDEYFAEPNVQFGIEIDVAPFEDNSPTRTGGHGLARWTPPEPVHTIPLFVEQEAAEVRVYSTAEGPVLVAAIELVSPSNKDRAEHRDAFLTKCATYLHQGMGLSIVDIVTSRNANLHHELMARLRETEGTRIDGSIYATAYRPVGENGQASLQIFTSPLALGATFESMPLWLRGGPCVPVELEAAYERTCREHRIS